MRCQIYYQSWAAQKRGLEATGILAGMSKAAGFTSVSQLLVTNPNAKRPASATAKRPANAPAEAPAAKVGACQYTLAPSLCQFSKLCVPRNLTVLCAAGAEGRQEGRRQAEG